MENKTKRDGITLTLYVVALALFWIVGGFLLPVAVMIFGTAMNREGKFNNNKDRNVGNNNFF